MPSDGTLGRISVAVLGMSLVSSKVMKVVTAQELAILLRRSANTTPKVAVVDVRDQDYLVDTKNIVLPNSLVWKGSGKLSLSLQPVRVFFRKCRQGIGRF